MVYLAGELDLNSSETAYPALISLLCEDDPRLVFDMQGVTFADSSGLSLLWQLSGFATRRGGWVRLARVRSQQLLVIGILGRTFPEPLAIYETLSAAVTDTQLPA